MYKDLEDAIEQVSAELFTKDEWQAHLSRYEDIGLSIDLYEMRVEVLAEVFERSPDLFNDMAYMNNENGMPLWVRPGVTWTPEQDPDEEDDY